MIMANAKDVWGPWHRHDGSGMPVSSGTVVEVQTLEPRRPKDGPSRRVGIAGVDLVHSWHWTPDRVTRPGSLPIDLYRVRRPKGMCVLDELLLLEEECAEVRGAIEHVP